MMILIILPLLLLIIFLMKRREPFAQYLTIVDPYSIYLHKDISQKEDWWNYDHNRKLYYYDNMVPQRYKE